MSDQARKHSIGLSGEFLVAGELQRRGIAAAVTYGNAKRADVVAIHEHRATAIEVKTTSQSKWVLGGTVPVQSGKLWVLVYLPSDESMSPEYFVLSGSELRSQLLPEHEAYMASYHAKHGKVFTGSGVVSIQRKAIAAEHKGAWHKVKRAVGI